MKINPNKIHLHWLCNSPSPYNDILFEALDADDAIELMVHFRRRGKSSHPWQSELGKGYRKRYAGHWLDIQLIIAALKSKECFFVIGGWNYFTAYAVIYILKLRKIPFAIWTDTPNLNSKRGILKRWVRSTLIRSIFRNAKNAMATGKPGVEALFKMGCSKRKIVNFPYWVELPRQLQGNRVEEGHTLIFFSVGQLIKRKGFNISLMAFRKALDKNNSKDVLYWIFGDGPERKNLENLSEELGLEQNVRFWGWREPKFIMGKLKNAHVLVHPALWEAYGVVVLEAMSYGKPVLGSSSTMGAVDRINDDENGFIHETGNIDQLSDQISLLIRDPEKINKFGESARSVAEEWPVENGVRIIKTKIIFDDKIAH